MGWVLFPPANTWRSNHITVLALLKKAGNLHRGKVENRQDLSWSNDDCRSQIGRVEVYERSDEGDLLG
jgi:hypothetical protein